MIEDQNNAPAAVNQDSEGLRMVADPIKTGEVVHEFKSGDAFSLPDGPISLTLNGGLTGSGRTTQIFNHIENIHLETALRMIFDDEEISMETMRQVLDPGKMVMIYGDFNSGKSRLFELVANEVALRELMFSGRETNLYSDSMGIDNILIGVESAIDNGDQAIYVDGANDARIVKLLIESVIHDDQMHAVVTFQPTATALGNGTGLLDQLFERFFDKDKFEAHLKERLIAIRVTKDSDGNFSKEIFSGDNLDKA